ncbi:MAG: ABC transporter permease [Rhodothermia bacterium]
MWRNKRRSFITMASVFFAVFLAVAMRSMQFGTYDRMIDNVVNSFSGHIQVHKAGYWDDQIIDNAMALDDLPDRIASNVEHVTAVFPRIESFALVATDRKTKGALVIGLDPEQEEDMLGLTDKLVSGRLFGRDDESVLIGEGLAKRLDLQVADTLVLLGQGYHGVTAAGKYPVAGILKFPIPSMNSGMLLMPFAAAQDLFVADGLATSLIVRLEGVGYIDEAYADIVSISDTTLNEVLTWKEIMPELVQTIQADNAGGVIMIAILYVVVSFGIFGTLLMMMNERQYEFGVLLSIGMSRLRLIRTTLFELLVLALGGALIGVAAAYPLQYYFKINPVRLTGEMAEVTEQYGWEPVLGTSTDIWISVAQTSGVLLITLVISVYAIVSLVRLKPVQAMRS